MADVAALAGQFVAFLISAVAMAAVAYGKKVGQKFEPLKFLETIITAVLLAVIGFALYLTGILPSPDTYGAMDYIATLTLAGPFTLFVQYLAQLIWRKVLGRGAG